MQTAKDSPYNELLILRCKRGDRDALSELIRTWEERLFYYIRRLVENEHDAWDILQQVWCKVIRDIRSLRENRSFPVWLYRIARNTLLNFRSGSYARRITGNIDEDLIAAEADDENLKFEDAQRVHEGLMRLSLQHREILTLHFLEDFSVEETAGILGIPAGTVKSRLYYAKRKLKSVLEEE